MERKEKLIEHLKSKNEKISDQKEETERKHEENEEKKQKLIHQYDRKY